MDGVLSKVGTVLKNKKRPVESFTKRDVLFAFLFLVASVLMTRFGVFGGFALGFTLSYLLLFSLVVSYLGKENFKTDSFPLLCGALSVLSSGVFSIYRDFLVNFVLFFVIIGLLSIFVSGCWDMNTYPFSSYRFLFGIGKTAVVNPVKYLSDLFRAFKNRKQGGKIGKKTIQIILGCLIAIPFLIIVVSNLLKADAAFENIVKTLFGNANHWLNVGNLLSLLPGVLLFPFVFSFVFNIKKRIGKNGRADITTDSNKFRKIGSTVFNTILVILGVCYLVYLFSQLAYFFNAFYGLLPDGYHFTTAEYARRGFFEMTVIVVVNLVLVGSIGLFAKIDTVHLPRFTKALCTFVNAFSLVLVATSFSKMYLYMNLYGLTRKRVLTVVMMTIFAIIIVFVTVKIFVPKFRYMEFIVIFCTVFGLGVAYADIDTQIARYNYNAYVSGAIKNIDIKHLATLSKSVAPYMANLAISSNREVAREAQDYFVNAEIQYVESPHNYKFVVVNDNAYKAWDEKISAINRLRN